MLAMGVPQWCSIARRFVDEATGTFVYGQILSKA
jgi:hypothetical protein